MSVRMHLHQYMGLPAAGGYAKFFSPGTSTAKTTYTSDYSTAASLNSAGGVVISTDGWLNTYLVGDYDMLVYTSTGTAIANAAATGLNPQESDTASALNLLSNGSFETDTNGDNVPDDWTLTSYSGATNALDSSDQQHGAKSMKFTSTGSGGGYIVSDDFIEITPERLVDISFLIKSTADVRNLVEIIWYDSGQVEISDTDVYDNSTTNPTSWATRGGVFAPPSTARYCKIRIYGCHSSDATAGTARFDGVQLSQVDAEVQTVASAATTNLNAITGKEAHISGTTTITGITLGEGRVVQVTFDGILTLTNGASLLLPGAGNILTAANDTAVFVGEASGVVRCLRYTPRYIAVANYKSGDRVDLYTGDSAVNSFDAATNITENTFESVGPTGSSATNTYADMDVIPANAKAAIFTIVNSITASGAGAATMDNYGRITGGSAAVGATTEKGGYADRPGAGNATGQTFTEVIIPLDGSNRCDITWVATGDSARAALWYLTGYIR